MALDLTSPVTGSAQTGFTAPTYTHVSDQAPDVNGKQRAVTALGGTQTGVRVHAPSDPFTITFWKPKVFRGLGVPNPVTGAYADAGRNVWRAITRKGVLPAVDQPARILPIETIISIPAGAESYDVANVRAALSLHIGALTQLSAALGDSVNNGTL